MNQLLTLPLSAIAIGNLRNVVDDGLPIVQQPFDERFQGRDNVRAFLEENPRVGKNIIEKAVSAARARLAEMAAASVVLATNPDEPADRRWLGLDPL